ncbi:MAG: benzoate-CoA ligase family protein, partial [Acidobacteriota bacterium]
KARGVRREERVLVALPDGLDFVGAFFGVLRIGAVVVMINPGLTPEDIAAQVDYTRARLLITDADHADAFRPLAEASPWLEGGLLAVDAEGADGLDAALAEADADAPPMAATHCDDAAVWLYSGGTTGRPKAVVQTHRSFVNTTVLYAQRTLGYGPDDVTISVPKLYFGYATGSNLLFPFSVGASAVLFDGPPTPEALFERIARHRATVLINVPTVVRRMVAHPQAAEQDLSSLRLATSAGEALPSSLHQRWADVFDVPLLDGLGTAEMWHVFLTNRVDDVRPGTLGRAVDGFELDVRSADGEPVGPDEIGRLWVKGDSRAIGYWQHMEKSADAFRGRWFVSGDLVRRDADGYVTFCGRGDDAIKVVGRWLIPREVEECLMGHPEVRECAVIGAPDAEGLTKPFAFVLPGPDADLGALEATLQEHCLCHLDAYKHPRRVITVDSWPRTHLGKIDRGALRRRLES